jgi:bifunctional DNase/RNase
MPRGQCIFRQGDVTKAVKAVVAAGVHVARVEVDRAGRIVVVAGKPSDSVALATESNEWDAP